MANLSQPPLVAGLSALAGGYRVLFCDVWGVIHNGVTSFADATAATGRFRRAGGVVLMLTNAPRPAGPIVAQLDALAVPREAYDAVVTSGDVTRRLLAEWRGRRVYHLGPDRDLPLYDGIGVVPAGPVDCEVVCCTGPIDDERETVADYEDRLKALAARRLPMICANPDLVVERGSKLIPCAGALAERYAEMGGKVAIAGKPHPPIYAAALAEASRIAGRPVSAAEVLAIGDGLRTDIGGAVAAGIDALFVASGIHGGELAGLAAIHARLAAEGLTARAVIPRLAW
ncbi:MAG: TIGR01459 family HAD-type hydrolase [Bauldia sp.]